MILIDNFFVLLLNDNDIWKQKAIFILKIRSLNLILRIKYVLNNVFHINILIMFSFISLTHKQNMNFTYLLRYYNLFRACSLFGCL